jgi:hypothetical protein
VSQDLSARFAAADVGLDSKDTVEGLIDSIRVDEDPLDGEVMMDASPTARSEPPLDEAALSNGLLADEAAVDERMGVPSPTQAAGGEESEFL